MVTGRIGRWIRPPRGIFTIAGRFMGPSHEEVRNHRLMICRETCITAGGSSFCSPPPLKHPVSMIHIPCLSRLVATVLCLLCLGRATSGQSINMDWTSQHDIDDRTLRSIADAEWKIVCFLGAECPLARLYASRLQQLADAFAARGVRVLGVNSNPQDSVADVRRFISEYDVSFPIIKDEPQDLARRFAATRTPEVFLLDGHNQVRYQGRIDDQYEPGQLARYRRNTICVTLSRR